MRTQPGAALQPVKEDASEERAASPGGSQTPKVLQRPLKGMKPAAGPGVLCKQPSLQASSQQGTAPGSKSQSRRSSLQVPRVPSTSALVSPQAQRKQGGAPRVVPKALPSPANPGSVKFPRKPALARGTGAATDANTSQGAVDGSRGGEGEAGKTETQQGGALDGNSSKGLGSTSALQMPARPSVASSSEPDEGTR